MEFRGISLLRQSLVFSILVLGLPSAHAWGIKIGPVSVGSGGVQVGPVSVSPKGKVDVKPLDEAVADAVCQVCNEVQDKADVIAKNTGGDTSKIASGVSRDIENGKEHVKTVVNGTTEAIDQLDEKPLDAWARLHAIRATGGLSEIVAKERMEEIREEKKQEHQAKINEAKKKNKTDAIAVIDNNIAELEGDAEILAALLDEIEFASIVSFSIKSLSELEIENVGLIDELGTDSNIDLVSQYYELMRNGFLDSEEPSSEDTDKLVKAGEMIVSAAELANVDQHTFISAVINKMLADETHRNFLTESNDELYGVLEELTDQVSEQHADTLQDIEAQKLQKTELEKK